MDPNPDDAAGNVPKGDICEGPNNEVPGAENCWLEKDIGAGNLTADERIEGEMGGVEGGI